jgi:hypothetical protein
VTLCGRCGEEVRKGWRDGVEAWWHRDHVDHVAVLGRPFTAADKAEVERQLDLPRVRTNKDGEEEHYTARELQVKAMNKAARDRLLEEGLDEEEIAAIQQVEIPEPEVRKTPIERADERCPQGARNLMNAASKAEWEVRRLTYSRGPWLGAKGNVLSISDMVVCGVVDSDRRYGVASWRDGKVVSAWYGEREGDRVPMALTTITDLKKRMKGDA